METGGTLGVRTGMTGVRISGVITNHLTISGIGIIIQLIKDILNNYKLSILIIPSKDVSGRHRMISGDYQCCDILARIGTTRDSRVPSVLVMITL